MIFHKYYQASFLQRKEHSWQVSTSMWTVSFLPGHEVPVPVSALSAGGGAEMALVQWLPALSRFEGFGLPTPTSSCYAVEQFPLRLCRSLENSGRNSLKHVAVAREGRPGGGTELIETGGLAPDSVGLP